MALKEVGRQEDDISGLCVGEHAAPAQIGIGILETAG